MIKIILVLSLISFAQTQAICVQIINQTGQNINVGFRKFEFFKIGFIDEIKGPGLKTVAECALNAGASKEIHIKEGLYSIEELNKQSATQLSLFNTKARYTIIFSWDAHEAIKIDLIRQAKNR